MTAELMLKDLQDRIKESLFTEDDLDRLMNNHRAFILHTYPEAAGTSLIEDMEEAILTAYFNSLVLKVTQGDTVTASSLEDSRRKLLATAYERLESLLGAGSIDSISVINALRDKP